ncbi:hypothetical protein LCGC14_0923590 [marine sediment metagenome]|uniref:WGR domain-containing protein n=1 Tax=marine sediment metagenome TaxID=412755 RepID=A0A0F9PAR5_9ZZZZ
MIDLWVVKNKVTGRYYQYIGKGCHRWVKSIHAGDNFTLSKAMEMVTDLKWQGYAAVEQHIEEE